MDLENENSTVDFFFRDEKPLLHLKKFNRNILKNHTDTFEFLVPQPDDNELNIIYSKGYYDTWGIGTMHEMVRLQKMKTFDARLNLLKSHLSPTAKLLDCGCATGFLMESAKQMGYDVYGIDISTFAAGESIRKFGTDHVYCGKLEEAIFTANPEGKFDAIFMMDYVEHVRDPLKILNEAYARLKTGGIILLTTPKLNSLSRKLMASEWSHYKEEHLFYFSSSSLEKILEAAGFTDVSEKPAVKYLSFAYIKGHFQTYRHTLFTPLIGLIDKLLPAAIKSKPIRYRLGDLMMMGTKKGS